MDQLSEKQKEWLGKLKGGEGTIPVKPYIDLKAKGLVEKVEGASAGRRGYTVARLTDAGRASLSA